jgi:hypothetical protein
VFRAIPSGSQRQLGDDAPIPFASGYPFDVWGCFLRPANSDNYRELAKRAADN